MTKISTIIIIIIIIALGLVIIFFSFYPRPTAIVRLTPRSKPVSGSLIIDVATHQIASTQQGSQTGFSSVQTTPGMSATGILTFKNSTFSWVTIAAGTSITSATGEEVVTDVALDVPPDPGAPGVASVNAHAVKLGSSSNIPAMSINKACCSAGIFVLNVSAFSGGTDSQTMYSVQQQDIDSVVGPLRSSLTQKARSDMQAHLTLGEHLLSPTFHCVSDSVSTPRVGESATNFTITLSLACSAAAYSLQSVPVQAESWLKQKAMQQLGPAFVLIGAVKTSIGQVIEGENGNAAVPVSIVGIWQYQFTATNKSDMVKYIVAKTKSDATSWLLRQQGVEDVLISESGPIFNWRGNNRLPDDVRAITLNA